MDALLFTLVIGAVLLALAVDLAASDIRYGRTPPVRGQRGAAR